MSHEHLENLRNKLEQIGWIVAEELEGNDYDISAVWLITRPNGSKKLHIDFQGLDDMVTLPIEKSYGCKVREFPKISLYFS